MSIDSQDDILSSLNSYDGTVDAVPMPRMDAVTQDSNSTSENRVPFPRVDSQADDSSESRPDTSKPSLSDTIGAAFRQLNPLVHAFTHGIQENKGYNLGLGAQSRSSFLAQLGQPHDPQFNAWPYIQGTDYEAHYAQFIGANDLHDVNTVKAQIDKDKQDQQFLANSGFTGVIASIAAGMLDPLSIIGGIGEYRALEAGMSAITNPFIRQAARTSAGFGTFTAVQNAQMMTENPEITPEESLKSVGESAAFGGLIGAAGVFGRVAGAAAGSSLMGLSAAASGTASTSQILGNALVGGIMGAAISVTDPDAVAQAKGYAANVVKNGEPGELDITRKSVGAAEARVIPDASIANLSPTVAKIVSPPIIRAPIIEGLTSESPLMRDLTSRLFETPLKLKENLVNSAKGEEGIPTPISVQTKLKQDQLSIDQLNHEANLAYLKYMQVVSGPFKSARAAIDAKLNGKMTFAEFNQKAADAMRNGDKSDIPEVQEYAQKVRAQFNKANEKMRALDLPDKAFWEEVDSGRALFGDESYLTNVYDTNKIVANRFAFEKDLADYYQSQGIESDDAMQKSREATDNVIGLGDNQVALSDIARLSLESGVRFTKERTIGIPSTYLASKGWLVNDLNYISNNYLRQAYRMVRFKEFLNSVGADNIAELKQQVKDEYSTNLTRVNDNPELAAKLTKNATKDINRLDDFCKIMLGQYALKTKADRALRVLKTYNYMRLMGQFAFTALPHLAVGVVRHGLGRTLTDGLLGSVVRFATGMRGAVLKDLEAFGVASDLMNNKALNTIINPDFASDRPGRFGRAFNALDTIYSQVSLVEPIINKVRQFYGYVAESRILHDIHHYEDLSDSEKTYLNSLHIGSEDVPKILTQFKQYGARYKGGYISNLAHWSDAEAQSKLFAAVRTEIDTDVPAAGQGDIPRIVQKSEIAKQMFQFKGFFSGVTSRVLISGLQNRDAGVVTGVLGMVALGAINYVARTYAQGKDPDLSEENLLMEGLSRSGALGLLSDPIFGEALKPFKVKGRSRYQEISPVEYLMGPTASALKNVSSIGDDLATGHFDDKTLKSIKNLIPFQNLFYLNFLFSKLNKDKKASY